MSQKNDNDEASFEGLVSFSTVPPPSGDVHNARTVMAELPEDVLASLKAGNRGLDPQGLGGDTPNEAVMTRRARPFELEKAVAAATARGSVPDGAGPTEAEKAAAISFAVEPPTFPSSVEIDSAVLAPPAIEDPKLQPDEADIEAPTTPRRSPRILRALAVVVLCIVAAVLVKLSLPFLRHRLHLDG